MSVDDAYFWDGAREGKLLLRQCSDCGRLAHPPVPMCPQCHGLSWGSLEASGKGRVYCCIMSKHPNRPEEEGRIVALIDLEEGVRIVSNIVDTTVNEVALDAPVEVLFATVGDNVLPQFRLVEEKL